MSSVSWTMEERGMSPGPGALADHVGENQQVVGLKHDGGMDGRRGENVVHHGAHCGPRGQPHEGGVCKLPGYSAEVRSSLEFPAREARGWKLGTPKTSSSLEYIDKIELVVPAVLVGGQGKVHLPLSEVVPQALHVGLGDAHLHIGKPLVEDRKDLCDHDGSPERGRRR